MKTQHLRSHPSLRILIAETGIERLKGLMFRKDLSLDTGLFLVKCNWVHSCFMKFAIDLIFIDENMIVNEIVYDFKPWRMGSPVFKAKHTLELKAGGAKHHNINIGDTIYVGD